MEFANIDYEWLGFGLRGGPALSATYAFVLLFCVIDVGGWRLVVAISSERIGLSAEAKILAGRAYTMSVSPDGSLSRA